MSANETRDAPTVLELGARGRHRGAAFALAGRTCVRNDAGALWNEWTLAFDDGRVGYLAEAMGSFTLLFEAPIAPPFDALEIGRAIETGFVVVERGHATRIARWGRAPDAPRRYRYAELSSATGERATIDYGAGQSGRGARPEVFVGPRVSLAEMGLRPRAARAHFFPAPAGPMPEDVELWLDVGDEGEVPSPLDIDGPSARVRVIGVLHRSIRVDGERYAWEEYALHAPAEGLRWLVVADGQATLVEGVEPGEVRAPDNETKATFRGQAFRLVSSGKARVEWAAGELPWPVAIGDAATARDYARGSHVLSRESTDDEIVWSFGAHVEPEMVARAFSKGVPPTQARPRGRAANPPRTHKRR